MLARRWGAWGELTYQGGVFKPGSTPTQTCHTLIGWRKSKDKKNLVWASNKRKIVNDGTGTEPCWIASLTDDFSAYVHTHVQTERAANIGGGGAHPGICSLTRVKLHLTHHITHKLHLLSTYVGPTSRCDPTWRCLRGINLPGRSLQTRLHPHLR